MKMRIWRARDRSAGDKLKGRLDKLRRHSHTRSLLPTSTTYGSTALRLKLALVPKFLPSGTSGSPTVYSLWRRIQTGISYLSLDWRVAGLRMLHRKKECLREMSIDAVTPGRLPHRGRCWRGRDPVVYFASPLLLDPYGWYLANMTDYLRSVLFGR